VTTVSYSRNKRSDEEFFTGFTTVYYEVAMMSQYSAAPRMGHIEAVYHIFLYLTKHDKSCIIFDASLPTLNLTNQQVEADWRPFYWDLKEEDLQHMLELLGKAVQIMLVR
jgi:hypothetical protein